MTVKVDIVFDSRLNSTLTVDIENDSGDPFNMTGYTGAAQLRKSYESTAYIPLTVSLANGQVTMVCPKLIANNAVEPGRYLYDLIIYDSSNSEVKLLKGIATVEPTITQIP
jgi:hypothetical protein